MSGVSKKEIQIKCVCRKKPFSIFQETTVGLLFVVNLIPVIH